MARSTLNFELSESLVLKQTRNLSCSPQSSDPGPSASSSRLVAAQDRTNQRLSGKGCWGLELMHVFGSLLRGILEKARSPSLSSEMQCSNWDTTCISVVEESWICSCCLSF